MHSYTCILHKLEQSSTRLKKTGLYPNIQLRIDGLEEMVQVLEPAAAKRRHLDLDWQMG